jgi:signal transduction histidine kinase
MYVTVKLSCRSKRFLITGLFLFACGTYAFAGQNPAVQDIIKQWSDIEIKFLSSQGGSANAILPSIDDFYNTVEKFQQSEMFRMYRFVPASRDQKASFGPAPPKEIREVNSAAELALIFRDAVARGDREKAMTVIPDIQDALMLWLSRDNEVDQFSRDAQFWLFMMLIGFVVLMAFITYFFRNALARSALKEAESFSFSNSFMLAQEEERKRISRELHDTIAQDLRYLSLGMNTISSTENAEKREKLCNEAAALQTQLIHRVRDICDNLIPPDFRFSGLPDILKKLCYDFGSRTGIDCHATITEAFPLDALSREKQLQIFRIVQEALTNVEKHAEASEAIVILRQGSEGELYIGISDDGKGFDYAEHSAVNKHSGGTHLGLRGMERRAALLGGTFTINSERGEGTLVCLQVPAKEETDGNVASGTAY